MKRLLLLSILMIGVFSAFAADYTHLTFETTDGAKISVPASSLSITISGTTLTAGSESFTLSNLSKMYFSTADETTGISEVLKMDSEDSFIAIFDLQGRKMEKEDMRSGQVYIVKTKNGTHKIAVK